MTAHLSDLDWDIRLYIYRILVDTGHPPATQQTADAFGLPVNEVRRAYHRLHRRHMIVLEPGTDDVRMAIPLSAVPTAYRVTIDGKLHYANCAWDSLGIPAMLHRDARIEADVDSGHEPIRYAIDGESLIAEEDLAIHFPMPLSQWIASLTNT